MHISDEEYFRSCVAKERHLAQLLGHAVEEFCETAGTLWDGTRPMPQWTRDWGACGPLIAQYDIAIAYDLGPGEAHPQSAIVGPVIVHFCDHPSKDRALMYAIVKAVIARIEHDRDRHKAPHHDAAAHKPG